MCHGGSAGPALQCDGEKQRKGKILISDATQMGVEWNVLTFNARVITFSIAGTVPALTLRYPAHCFKTKVEAAYLTA